MYSEEDWSVMREKMRNAINISQVARELEVNWRTAKKYMSSPTPPKYSPRKTVPSNLEPYKDYILGRLEKWPLTAVKIFEEIQERGYTGGYTVVKEFVRPFKRDKAIAAELRYETKPGQQGQADWFR
jgi:transposase